MAYYEHARVVQCDEDRTRRLLRLAQQVEADPNRDLDAFLVEIGPLVAELPLEVREALMSLKDPTGPGCVLVRGLPVDPALNPTPAGGRRPTACASWVGEALLLAIGQTFLGEPYTLANEKRGAIPADIVPVPGREKSLSNEGSSTALHFHREICFDQGLSPSFLALFCQRQDREAQVETLAVDARDVVAALEPHLLDFALQSRFETRCPASVEKETGVVTWSAPHPIVEGPSGNPGLRLDLNATRGLDAAAQKVLELVGASLEPLALSIVLQPGDLLVINNRRVCHARSGFTADFGPAARWLLRAYFKTDVWSIRDRYVCNRRVR